MLTNIMKDKIQSINDILEAKTMSHLDVKMRLRNWILAHTELLEWVKNNKQADIHMTSLTQLLFVLVDMLIRLETSINIQ